MSIRTYEKEEKQAYVEDFKNSGETIGRYALEHGIPETTLRGWIKEDKELAFGAIEIKASSNVPLPRITKSATIFATENIRIELKENYNKELLRKIVEVLINDK